LDRASPTWPRPVAAQCSGSVEALTSDACHVSGEEVHAVSVEVAAGAVVVLGGSRVGVAGEDLRVA